MHPEKFAHQLACWLSPGILARAAQDWSDVPRGREPVVLRFESTQLSHSTEARFEWFVRAFLDHVVIPAELVRFVHGMYPRHVTPAAADWLRNFQFTGALSFDPPDCPMPSGRQPLVAVTAPQCEIRVIWPVMEMLHDLLAAKAWYWRRVATLRPADRIHHEVFGEWDFETWVDLQVARACGFPELGKAGRVSSVGQLTNLRGCVSVHGPLPPDRLALSLYATAASLHPEVRSPAFKLHREMTGP